MTFSRTLKTIAVSSLVIGAVATNAFAAGGSAPAKKPSASECAKLKTDAERTAKGCEAKK